MSALTRVEQTDEAAELSERLRLHAESYATAVARCIEELFGVELVPDPEGARWISRFESELDFHVSIPFSGTVQGEYIIVLDRNTAGALVGIELDEMEDQEEADAAIGDIGSALSEVLNTVVGSIIVEIGDDFPHLTFAAPRMTLGKRYYPAIQMMRVALAGDVGQMDAYFYVDQMKLDIATSYSRAVSQVSSIRAQASEQLDTMDRVFDKVQAAMLVIDENGAIAHRSFAASQRIFGGASAHCGEQFTTLIENVTNNKALADSFGNWLKLAVRNYEPERWRREIAWRRPPDILRLATGQLLRMSWSPVQRRSASHTHLLVEFQPVEGHLAEIENAGDTLINLVMEQRIMGLQVLDELAASLFAKLPEDEAAQLRILRLQRMLADVWAHVQDDAWAQDAARKVDSALERLSLRHDETLRARLGAPLFTRGTRTQIASLRTFMELAGGWDEAVEERNTCRWQIFATMTREGYLAWILLWLKVAPWLARIHRASASERNPAEGDIKLTPDGSEGWDAEMRWDTTHVPPEVVAEVASACGDIASELSPLGVELELACRYGREIAIRAIWQPLSATRR